MNPRVGCARDLRICEAVLSRCCPGIAPALATPCVAGRVRLSPLSTAERPESSECDESTGRAMSIRPAGGPAPVTSRRALRAGVLRAADVDPVERGASTGGYPRDRLRRPGGAAWAEPPLARARLGQLACDEPDEEPVRRRCGRRLGTRRAAPARARRHEARPPGTRAADAGALPHASRLHQGR